MSRKSVSKKSSLSREPLIEDPSSDEERLDLEKIVQIDPWKDIEKYDKQEAGQIQQVLVEFNDMVLNDKRNKRRSGGKNRTSSTSELNNNNETTEEESTRKKNTKIYKMQRWISEPNVNDEAIIIVENVATDNTNDTQNTEENNVGNRTEEAMPNDKKNRRKSGGKNRASLKSKTSNNNEAVEEEVVRKQNTRNDKVQGWISESNVGTENSNDKENSEKKIVEEKTEEIMLNDKKNKRKSGGKNRPSLTSNTNNNNEAAAEDESINNLENVDTENSEKKTAEGRKEEIILNKEKNKRKSCGINRASSTSKTSNSNQAAEEKSKRKENTRNDKVQRWIRESNVNDESINTLKNVATENTNVNKSTEQQSLEEKEEELRKKEEKSSKTTNRGRQKLFGNEMAAAAKAIADREEVEGESSEKQGIRKEKFWNWIPISPPSNTNVEENISEDCNHNNEPESLEEENKLEEAAEKSVVDINSTVHRDEIRTSVSPLPPINDQSGHSEDIELPIDAVFADFIQHESLISNILSSDNGETSNCAGSQLEKSDLDSDGSKYGLKNVVANSTMQSSITKAHSAKQSRLNNAEFNDNEGCLHKTRKLGKIAKAFKKFGKEFVKYSQQPQKKTQVVNISIDSESDSEDSSSSSSSFCSCTSGSSSSSSSRCSCCFSSSTENTYFPTGSESSISTSSCSCSCCGDDDEYSEYTLASSGSTYPGSDESSDLDSSDSSTD